MLHKPLVNLKKMGYNIQMSGFKEKLKFLPTAPGVYVMLDKAGTVIYVGKAKNLKNRVRQYFFNTVKTDKVMAMVNNVADFYYIIAPSEIDALSLENNLIKKHKPHYNILLKDDKTYPFIKVNVKEDFPTFSIARKIKKDGAKYFGPYMGGISVKSVLEILNLAFCVRPCDKKLCATKKLKPCLNHHLKICLAPCAGLVSREEYLERVNLAIEFLSGNIAPTEKLLKEKMFKASEKEEFELALKYKENLLSLSKIALKRLTSLNKFLNADIISCASNGIYYAINVLIVRNGMMSGGKNYSFTCAQLEDGETLRQFVMSYYKDGADFPQEVISDVQISDAEVLSEYFKKNFEKNIKFLCAKQGTRKQLADMANANAKEHLNVAVDKIKHKDDMTINACKKLQEILNLKNYPKRMECFDISNISGVDKVGSMVVFTDGVADKNQYRRFKIKTFEGADDFRSLKEVLSRRFDRLNSSPEKFEKPNLIIIDGGKGQLSSVQEIFREKGIENIDLISLAEREEEIFLPNKSQPIVLPKSDYCLRLLQRIRDEAHRFAITYHRTLRGKRALSSILDDIKGLGKVKKLALIEHFKDLGGIISATQEQLQEVEGIGSIQAKLIIDKLTEEGLK